MRVAQQETPASTGVSCTQVSVLDSAGRDGPEGNGGRQRPTRPPPGSEWQAWHFRLTSGRSASPGSAGRALREQHRFHAIRRPAQRWDFARTPVDSGHARARLSRRRHQQSVEGPSMAARRDRPGHGQPASEPLPTQRPTGPLPGSRHVAPERPHAVSLGHGASAAPTGTDTNAGPERGKRPARL